MQEHGSTSWIRLPMHYFPEGSLQFLRVHNSIGLFLTLLGTICCRHEPEVTCLFPLISTPQVNMCWARIVVANWCIYLLSAYEFVLTPGLLTSFSFFTDFIHIFAPGTRCTNLWIKIFTTFQLFCCYVWSANLWSCYQNRFVKFMKITEAKLIWLRSDTNLFCANSKNWLPKFLCVG